MILPRLLAKVRRQMIAHNTRVREDNCWGVMMLTPKNTQYPFDAAAEDL